MGPGGGATLGWGLHDIATQSPSLTDYTKPQKSTQSPNKQYKAHKHLFPIPYSLGGVAYSLGGCPISVGTFMPWEVGLYAFESVLDALGIASLGP